MRAQVLTCSSVGGRTRGHLEDQTSITVAMGQRTQTTLTENVNLILLGRGEAYHVEHLPLSNVPTPIPPQEVFRLVQLFAERLELRAVVVVRQVPREDQDLESGVGREQVVDLNGFSVRNADEHLREHALPDDKVGTVRLVCVVDDRGGGVADAGAGPEAHSFLERTTSARSDGFLLEENRLR